MSFLSPNRHVFVIQLWVEPRETEGAPEQWRGIIEHTISGQRHAVFTPDDVNQFIKQFVTYFDLSQKSPGSLKEKLNRTVEENPGDEPKPNE